MGNPVVEATLTGIVVVGLIGLWVMWPQIRPALDAWFAALAPRRSVNHSQVDTSRYVTSSASVAAPRSSFPVSHGAETENETETEIDGGNGNRVVLEREKLYTLLSDARAEGYLHGSADTLGRLLGGGFLDAIVQDSRLTEAKGSALRTLDGKVLSGRALSGIANPRIQQAKATAEAERKPEPEEVRVIRVDGQRDLVL